MKGYVECAEMKNILMLGALAGMLCGVAAAADPAVFMRFELFLHRPEVFADQRLGLLPEDPHIPIGAPIDSLWYVRVKGPLPLFGTDRLRELVWDREIPGVDLSGQRDLFDPPLEALIQSDMGREMRHPFFRRQAFRLINLSGTRVSDRSMRLVGRLPNLEVLILNDRITDQGMAQLEGLSHLTELRLGGSKVGDKGVEILRRFPRLSRLDLGGTEVTDHGLEALKDLPLIELALGPRITDAAVLSAAAFKNLGQLDLSQTRITDQGLAAFAQVKGLHTLFAPHGLTDRGARALAGLHGLRRLDMTGTSIGDTGLASLSALHGLEELALTGTRVTGRGLPALRRFSHLRYLELSGTAIAPEELARLEGCESLEVISFSSKAPVKAAQILPLGRLPKLRAIVVNGYVIDPKLVNYLKRKAGTPQAGLGFIAEVWAVEPEEIQLDKALEAASAENAPLDNKEAPIRLAGLRRVHEAESEIDDVIPAVNTPAIEEQQDTEKNFLGEFEVNSTSPRKQPAKP